MSPNVLRANTERAWRRLSIDRGNDHPATVAALGRMAAAWSTSRVRSDLGIQRHEAQVAYARATLHPGFLNRHRRRRLVS